MEEEKLPLEGEKEKKHRGTTQAGQKRHELIFYSIECVIYDVIYVQSNKRLSEVSERYTQKMHLK